MLSAWIAPPASKVSVFAAPIARARASVAASASASAASLWGIVTLAPTKPAAGQAADGLVEAARAATGQQLVAPVVQAQRARSAALVHRRRAAVGDRPAEDAEARRVTRSTCRRLGAVAAVARARGVVGGDVALELRVGRRERVRAARRRA